MHHECAVYSIYHCAGSDISAEDADSHRIFLLYSYLPLCIRTRCQHRNGKHRNESLFEVHHHGCSAVCLYRKRHEQRCHHGKGVQICERASR